MTTETLMGEFAEEAVSENETGAESDSLVTFTNGIPQGAAGPLRSGKIEYGERISDSNGNPTNQFRSNGYRYHP